MDFSQGLVQWLRELVQQFWDYIAGLFWQALALFLQILPVHDPAGLLPFVDWFLSAFGSAVAFLLLTDYFFPIPLMFVLFAFAMVIEGALLILRVWRGIKSLII